VSKNVSRESAGHRQVAAFHKYSGTWISFCTRSLFAGVPKLFQMIGGPVRRRVRSLHRGGEILRDGDWAADWTSAEAVSS
jgi:hypothetical protein